MPSITQLQYILAVHETGHFGRAATLAGVSQPTLSTQIQKAEAALGVTIFNRQSKPIVATPPGRALIEHAQAVVSAHQNLLRHAAGNFESPTGELVLGVIPTLAPYVLPWFLARFADEYPTIELRVLERPTDTLVTEISRNRVDVALLATPLHEGSLDERVLFYDPFYVYGNPSEELMAEAEVEVEALDPRKLWLLEDGHCVRTQVTSFCGLQEREHLGSVRFAGGSLETIRHLIDASEGYTLVPETYARTLSKSARARSVRAFAGGVPTREISLVHHSKSWKLDLIEVLEQTIRASLPRALANLEPDEDTILPVRAPG